MPRRRLGFTTLPRPAPPCIHPLGCARHIHVPSKQGHQVSKWPRDFHDILTLGRTPIAPVCAFSYQVAVHHAEEVLRFLPTSKNFRQGVGHSLQDEGALAFHQISRVLPSSSTGFFSRTVYKIPHGTKERHEQGDKETNQFPFFGWIWEDYNCPKNVN